MSEVPLYSQSSLATDPKAEQINTPPFPAVTSFHHFWSEFQYPRRRPHTLNPKPQTLHSQP